MSAPFIPPVSNVADGALAVDRLCTFSGSDIVYASNEHSVPAGVTVAACSDDDHPSLANLGRICYLTSSGAIGQGDRITATTNGVAVSAESFKRFWCWGYALEAASGNVVKAFIGAFHRIDSDLPAAQVDLATAGAGTYLTAHFKAGYIERDCAGAGRTDTTDTAANLIAGLGLDADGKAATLLVYNSSDAAESITIAGGTGVTLGSAEATCEQGELSRLTIIRTSSTTCDLWVETIAD